MNKIAIFLAGLGVTMLMVAGPVFSEPTSASHLGVATFEEVHRLSQVEKADLRDLEQSFARGKTGEGQFEARRHTLKQGATFEF